MTVDSLAHRRLTIGLFIFVIGGMFAVNAYATGGGLREMATVVVTVAIICGVSYAINRLWGRR